MLNWRGVAVAGLALALLLTFGRAGWAQNELKSPIMDKIKQRGELVCGIDTGIPGYAFQDSKGGMAGPGRSLLPRHC